MGRITETIKVLIVINVLFFIGTLIIGEVAERLFALYYFENPNFQFWQPLSSMFMHGGLMHILFNMYALWAFGSPLEISWGRNKFLFLYFSAGFGSVLIYTLVNYYFVHSGFDAIESLGYSNSDVWSIFNNTLAPGSYREIPGIDTELLKRSFSAWNVPAVGASGAIYGVLVAFGIMFPNIELMLIFLPIPIKAKYFIPALILIDLYLGVTGAATGIAHFAHLGGALFGFIIAWYWKKNSFDNHRWN